MGGLATDAGLIGRLFGPDVSGALARLDRPLAEPSRAGEAELVAGAVNRRRHEFLVGRGCAHAALATIGRDDGTIGVGPRREPLWPPGIVGSITHGGWWAAAVVARADQARALGVDIEPVEPPLSEEVRRLVLSTTEQQRQPGDQIEAHQWAKVAFMAKECVYKALYPSSGWVLNFADVDVDVDCEEGRWQARLTGEGHRREGSRLSGHFEVWDRHLFCAVRVEGDRAAREKRDGGT